MKNVHICGVNSGNKIRNEMTSYNKRVYIIHGCVERLFMVFTVHL